MAQVNMAALPALKDAYSQLKTRMDKAVEAFRKELTGQRTGRASVHMLDQVKVDYYGRPTAHRCRWRRWATSAHRSRN